MKVGRVKKMRVGLFNEEEGVAVDLWFHDVESFLSLN